MQNLRLTLLQTDLHWHNPAANRKQMEELVTAESASSDLIVLPETFTTGFTMDAPAVAEHPEGETADWMSGLATTLQVNICGSVIISENGCFFNRLIWAAPDGRRHAYDKRHLFRMVGERANYTPGRARLIVEVAGWRVCPMICYDLRFPVWSRNRGDYDLLLYVANWPASRRSAWETLLPARSVENLCYAAGVNRTGTDGNGVDYAGGSMVADYFGQKIAVGNKQPAVLKTELSMEKLTRYREKFPAWKDADEFTLVSEPPA
jgi:predicted amidohydrolase